MSFRRFDPEKALLAEIDLAAKKSVAMTNELIAASQAAVRAWKAAPYMFPHEVNVAMQRLDKLVGSPNR